MSEVILLALGALAGSLATIIIPDWWDRK